MPSRTPPRPAAHCTPADTREAVDAFMTRLAHPGKAAIEALRGVVTGADPAIAEGIKWNAPSFRTHEYFATVHLRSRNGLDLILHLGAKVRALPATTPAIEDPDRLLDWLARDRARVHFDGIDAIHRQAAALQALLRQWIGLL